MRGKSRKTVPDQQIDFPNIGLRNSRLFGERGSSISTSCQLIRGRRIEAALSMTHLGYWKANYMVLEERHVIPYKKEKRGEKVVV